MLHTYRLVTLDERTRISQAATPAARPRSPGLGPAFAVTGNVGYYLLLVLGIDLIGAPITDIIIGAIPVALAVAGNVTSRSHPWGKLVAPMALAIAGLLMANLSGTGQAGASRTDAGEAFGFLAASGAVAQWRCTAWPMPGS
jgi:drug/metabolite transporter (DMT)-like permease